MMDSRTKDRDAKRAARAGQPWSAEALPMVDVGNFDSRGYLMKVNACKASTLCDGGPSS
jgi:hypothetical protein